MSNLQWFNQAAGRVLLIGAVQPESDWVCSVLQGAGHTVLQASDGEQGAQLLSAGGIDLILLDMFLPPQQAAGLWLCVHASTTEGYPPIVLLCGQQKGRCEQGWPAGAADCISLPCSEQQLLQRVHAQLQLRLLPLLNDVMDLGFSGVMITDRNAVVVRINPAFTRITGYTPAEILGQTPRILRSGSHDAAFYQQMWQSLQSSGQWAGEILNRHKDGNVSPMMQTITAVRRANGEITHFVAVLVDVSESQNTRTLIDFLAYRDALTGLPNRLVARRQFDLAVEHHDPDSHQLIGVFCIDLDRFKTINDSLGHSLGDQILKLMADRLAGLVEEPRMVSRQGGDEFLLLVPQAVDLQQLAQLANQVVQSIAEVLIADDRKWVITASMGIAVYPHDGHSLDELMRRAENALYRAKGQGGNRYCFFTQEMDADVHARMEMESLLHDAAANSELQVVYQPKIIAATGEIAGAEALIRWNNPTLGNVSPLRFIPLAEETGLISSIGEWVMHRVCRELLQWREQGLGLTKIAINLSATQFRRHDMCQLVEGLLAQYGLPASAIDLEITESTLMQDVEKANQVLLALQKIGVTVSLDDFGTGYSSLSYLKHFPLNTLKIDKSFVDRIPLDHADSAIAQTIIALARNLGMTVVAEGVETAAQFEFLRDKGCDLIQGYYFSKPVAATEFARLLSQRYLPLVKA